MTKTFLVLIGLPGCGKTTFANEFIKTHTNYRVLSPDYILENMLKIPKSDYRDLSSENFKQVNTIIEELYKLYIDFDVSIILDENNLSKKYREKWTSKAKLDGFKIEYMVFRTFPEECCARSKGIYTLEYIKKYEKVYEEPIESEYDIINSVGDLG